MYKSLFERQETILVNLPCFWIQIPIPNTDKEPGQPNKCGFMRIRIHNIGNYRKWPAILSPVI
jgi:hypothetical protein